MDLRQQLLLGHSRQNAEAIAQWVGNDPYRFGALVNLFLNDEYRIIQRAVWPLAIVSDKYPELLNPHLEKIIGKMVEPGVPVAVKRNITRILPTLHIPEEMHGVVISACFNFLADSGEAIAVQAHSMSVLAKMAKLYPDIKTEAYLAIEERLKNKSSAGLRSRAHKVMKELQK